MRLPLLFSQNFAAPRRDLQEMENFLRILGNPHQSLPPIIHVAGTNGKGSTLAFLHSILQEAGYSVHKYTSPHLKDFHERIVVQGHPISPPLFQKYWTEALQKAYHLYPNISQRLPLSWFEMLTATAFLVFSRIPADVVLLETGLGGQYDATNVIRRPLATILTSISLDHQDQLGTTLSQIAKEKAGILKSQSPLITCQQKPEVYAVLQEKIHHLSIPGYIQNHHWTFSSEPLDSFDSPPSKRDFQPAPQKEAADLPPLSSTFCFRWEESQEMWTNLPPPPLEGPHQIENLGLAIATLKVLNTHFPVTVQKLRRGIQKTIWPGRLQKLGNHGAGIVFPPHTEIWIDGAHNPGGAEALACIIQTWPSKPILVLGLMASKPPLLFMHPFRGKIKEILTIPLSQEMGHSPEALAYHANQAGLGATPYPSLKQALHALAKRPEDLTRILITGSLYLMGECLKI